VVGLQTLGTSAGRTNRDIFTGFLSLRLLICALRIYYTIIVIIIIIIIF
jgi:hypothetical protein